MRTIALLALTLSTLAACSRSDDGSMPFRAVGPEQSTFFVTPAEPLEVPPVITLVTPTPSGDNRAEQ